MEEQTLAHKILENFKDEAITVDIATKIYEMHLKEIEELKRQIISSVNRIFE